MGLLYLRLDVSNLFDVISDFKRGNMLVMLYDEDTLQNLTLQHSYIMETKGMLKLLRAYAVKCDAVNEELLQHLQSVRNKFKEVLPARTPLTNPGKIIEETLKVLRTETEAKMVEQLNEM